MVGNIPAGNNYHAVPYFIFCQTDQLAREVQASGASVQRVNSASGIVTIVGTSGVSVVTTDNTITIGTAAVSGGGNPVDSRAVTGAIIPDTNLAYDIGISGTRYATVAAESGFIHHIQAPSGHLDLMPGSGQRIRFFGMTNQGMSLYDADDGTQYWTLLRNSSNQLHLFSNDPTLFAISAMSGPIYIYSVNDSIQLHARGGDTQIGVSGHITPVGDTDVFDLGNSTKKWRTLNAVSGIFDTAGLQVNSSGVPVSIVGLSGIIINNDGLGNIAIAQNAPVDVRVVTGHINPDTDNTYDIGQYDPLGGVVPAYRLIAATSGAFSSVVGSSPLRLKDPNSECFVVVSGVSNEEIAIVPSANNSGYLGHSSAPWNEVRAIDFYSDGLTSITGTIDYLIPKGGIEKDGDFAIELTDGSSTTLSIAPDVDQSHYIGTPSFQFADIYAATKSFIMQHPLYSGLLIRYSAIEGPEAGAYVRGSGQLSNGTALVPFGKQFHHVHDPEWTTVHVTPTQDCNGMFVPVVGVSGFIVRELNKGTSNAKFNWVAMTKRWDQADEHRILVPVDKRTTWKQMQARYERYKARLAKIGRVPKFVVPSGGIGAFN